MDVDELQRRAKDGPRALLARRALAVSVGVVSTVTIPHLVPPGEYGLATMSIVVFGLADMFKDMGLTSALLRKGEIRPDEVTFLFWFNAAMTLILAGLLAAAAPLTAAYFGEPRVTLVMLVSVIGFVADGLSLQHRSVMTRDLRFRTLATLDSGVTLLQFAVTLLVAAAAHDVWAIVAGYVFAKAFGAGLTMMASKWRPGPPKWLPQARPLYAFGANVSVYNLSVFISHNIAAILIGRYFGAVELGQYNRATALQWLPLFNFVAPLAEATLPVLARLRPRPDLYRQAYLDLVRNLNIVVWPAAAVVFFTAQPLVTLVLGPRWAEAGRLLHALAPMVATPGLGYAANDLFITQNRSAELRTLGFVELTFRVIGVLVALPYGAVAIAAAYSATTTVVVLARIAVAGRTGPVSIRDHIVAVAPAAPLAIGALAGCWLGASAAEKLMLPLPSTAALSLAGGAAGCLLALAAGPSRRGLIALAGALRGRNA